MAAAPTGPGLLLLAALFAVVAVPWLLSESASQQIRCQQFCCKRWLRQLPEGLVLAVGQLAGLADPVQKFVTAAALENPVAHFD